MAAAAPIALGMGMAGSTVSTFSNVAAADARSKVASAEATSIQQQAQFEETEQRRVTRSHA